MSQTSDSAGERFALQDENTRLRRDLAAARIERDQHRGDLITAKADLAAARAECERLKRDLHRSLVGTAQLHEALASREAECERLREACESMREEIRREINKTADLLYDDEYVILKGKPVKHFLSALAAPAADAGEPAGPCRPRRYSPDELGRDLGELERQIAREGVDRG